MVVEEFGGDNIVVENPDSIRSQDSFFFFFFPSETWGEEYEEIRGSEGC